MLKKLIKTLMKFPRAYILSDLSRTIKCRVALPTHPQVGFLFSVVDHAQECTFIFQPQLGLLAKLLELSCMYTQTFRPSSHILSQAIETATSNFVLPFFFVIVWLSTAHAYTVGTTCLDFFPLALHYVNCNFFFPRLFRHQSCSSVFSNLAHKCECWMLLPLSDQVSQSRMIFFWASSGEIWMGFHS